MKRTFYEIRQEIEKRGVRSLTSKEIALWGIMFAIEDLSEKLKKDK